MFACGLRQIARLINVRDVGLALRRPRRNKITLMEEIAHVHLRHNPSQLVIQPDGVVIRDFDRAQEEDAYGVGAAALLPWGGFFRAINLGRTADEVAEEYDVTAELVEYRIKIAGAFHLYKARQRQKV